MLLGRAYHVIVSGGGIVGIVRALLYGTNVPKTQAVEKTLTNEEKYPSLKDHEKPTS
jgi:hypothetical protein